MKTNQTLKTIAVALFLTLHFAISQAQIAVTADTIRNTCGEGGSDMLFQLCDSTIMKLSIENGNVGIGTNNPTEKLDVKGNLRVSNKLITDSIISNNILPADTFNIKGNVKVSNRLYSDTVVVTRILAKDSLIYFGDSTLIFNTLGNAMWTDNGALRIQSNAANNFSTIINAGISAGVGIGNSFPQEKLQIHQDDIGGVHQSVYTLFTNELNGYSISPLPGFKVGISSGLNGEIRQERNLPLNFFTDNIQHVTVLANGNVGIGDFFTVEPKKRLDIFDSTDAQLIYSISKIFLTGTSNALAIS